MTNKSLNMQEQKTLKIKENNKHTSIITVGSKRILEYVFDCLAQYNRGTNETILRSFGQNISRAAEVLQILEKNFNIKAKSTNIRQLTKKDTCLTTMENIIRCENKSVGNGDFSLDPETDFIEFPVYHLLLDSLLYRNNKLKIGIDSKSPSAGKQVSDPIYLLTVTASNGSFKCTPGKDLVQIIGKRESEEDQKKRRDIFGHLVSAFYRCSLVLSPSWGKVAKGLSKFDDIILGLDTNILYNCVLTQQLLDSFSFENTSTHTNSPNWILVIVPSAVMHEIEQAANSRNEKGSLGFIGRMGYRALQEIMEIDQSKDILGLSLLIAGEANPILDTRVELQGLRTDFKTAAEHKIQPSLYRKLSSGDTIIRDQFKCFLRQINFHKGTFFMTSDKSNSALARAEGLHSIYYQQCPWHYFLTHGQKVEPPILEYDSESINMNVPFGKLIYELAVEFGAIWIGWDENKIIKIQCDVGGESLDRWVNRDLRIDKRYVKLLLENYKTTGKFSLDEVRKKWYELGEDLKGEDVI